MTQHIINRFNVFHSDNPIVYEYMLQLCRQLREAGFDHYGIKAVYERMRWHFNVDLNTGGDEEYLFNNDFCSLYARKLMEENPELQGFFTLRRLWTRSDDVPDYEEALV